MSTHKMTTVVFQSSFPPPPPPPPPPLSSQPSTSFTFIAGSPQLSSHHHQENNSHLTDPQSLTFTKTPIQKRKEQLYKQYQGKPESPTFESHLDSGFSQPLQSPSKLMQSELRRSRHCATRIAVTSDSPSIASNEGYSTAHCLPTVTPASGSAVAANYASPLRQFPLPNGPIKSHQFQQNAPSFSGHHRCNKHQRINGARGSTSASSSATNVKSTSFSSSSSATTVFEQANGQNPSSPVHSSSNGGATSVFDGSKKSRCILFSQIYLIAHVSVTLCLSEIRENHLLPALTAKELILDAYLAYILIVGLIFFFLLRCYATPSELNDRHFNELTEQSPVLYGATVLGLSELTLSGIRILNCLESEFVILPMLKFLFSCFLMHFLLTQVIHSDYIGLRNIAIAHLLATQISLWILSLSSESVPYEPLCNYTFDPHRFRFIHGDALQNMSNEASSDSLEDEISSNLTTGVSIEETSKSRSDLFTLLQSLLTILTHQFKLLTIFILITMWFTNNQSKINFIRAKLSDEEVLRASSMRPEKRRFLLKGFGFGLFFFAIAIAAVVLPEKVELRHCSIIAIQFLITFIALTGLVIRRRKKYLNPKYQINVLKHHFIIFFTLFATFISCFLNIVLLFQQQWSSSLSYSPFIFTSHLNSTTTTSSPIITAKVVSKDDHLHQQLIFFLSLLSWSSLLLQVTVQTYLLRLQGKKLVDMSTIFALLVTANLSLWIVDVSGALQLATTSASITTTPLPINTLASNTQVYGTTITRILTMFVTLNRYYCTLIFVHFWKMRI